MTALGIKLVKHWVTRHLPRYERFLPGILWSNSDFFFHSGLFKPWRLSTPRVLFFLGQNSWWPPGLLVSDETPQADSGISANLWEKQQVAKQWDDRRSCETPLGCAEARSQVEKKVVFFLDHPVFVFLSVSLSWRCKSLMIGIVHLYMIYIYMYILHISYIYIHIVHIYIYIYLFLGFLITVCPFRSPVQVMCSMTSTPRPSGWRAIGTWAGLQHLGISNILWNLLLETNHFLVKLYISKNKIHTHMFDSQYPMTSTTSHHSPNRSSLGAGDAMLASISVRYMWVMRYKKAFRFTKKAPFRSDKTGAALGCWPFSKILFGT